MLRGPLTACALIGALALSSGCQKTQCDKLVAIACDHVSDKDDGVEQCDRLKAQAKTVSNEECEEILQLLEESGKLGSPSR
ncbi:MAG: hypothetical protein ACI9WU_002248 [Myxococcota bacterium]|jgi:hypothetical protein